MAKKLFIVLQVLVFVWTSNVYAADGSTQEVQTETNASTEQIDTQMPNNYKLPDMHMLDSVVLHNRYKDKIGNRLDVDSYIVRIGATWGEDFKQKIYQIERDSKERVEIILTLSSTLPDAKILKDRMALVGRKMMIVEIPDEVQAKYLARMEAQAAGGIKELWFDTKDKANKIAHPINTLSNMKKIFKNQIVKPSNTDISLAKISIGTSIAGTALALVVGADPTLACSLLLARIIIGGSNRSFYKTVNNFFKSDLTDEMNMTSPMRQFLTKFFILGFGIGESYYGVGAVIAGATYKYTQEQLFSNMMTSGLIDTAGSVERDRRLSEQATYRMVAFSIMISTVLSAFSNIGLVGPIMMEKGIFQITALQAGTIAIFTGLYIGYRFFSKHVEKVAQQNLVQIALEKAARAMRIQKIHNERIQKENAEFLSSLWIWKRAPAPLKRAAVCSSLFQ